MRYLLVIGLTIQGMLKCSVKKKLKPCLSCGSRRLQNPVIPITFPVSWGKFVLLPLCSRHVRAETQEICDYVGIPYTVEEDGNIDIDNRWLSERGFQDNLRHDADFGSW